MLNAASLRPRQLEAPIATVIREPYESYSNNRHIPYYLRSNCLHLNARIL
jgi:hypothetical protein